MIITLLTDFGLSDTYVGQVKGRILSEAPGVTLVDLTHDIPPGNIEVAARLLRHAVDSFPGGSIHLCVVDPGVGSSRRGVVVRWRDHILVGPDNGVFTMFMDGGAEVREIHPRYLEARYGQTFHGRDLFAPVTASLASGVRFEKATSSIVFDPIEIEISRPREEGKVLVGRVWYSDRFGNLVTDIPVDMLEGRSTVSIGRMHLYPIRETFSLVPPGTAVAYKGSFGYLEIGVNQGRAADLFNNINKITVRVS